MYRKVILLKTETPFSWKESSQVTYQNAILQIACRTPMKHSGRIVFHFGFFKVKVLWLIISNASWHWYAIALLGSRSTATTCWPSSSRKKYILKRFLLKTNCYGAGFRREIICIHYRLGVCTFATCILNVRSQQFERIIDSKDNTNNKIDTKPKKKLVEMKMNASKT